MTDTPIWQGPHMETLPAVGKPIPRRIVQIATASFPDEAYVFAICNDGTTWRLDNPIAEWHRDCKWSQLPEIPQ